MRLIDADALEKHMCNTDYSDEPCEPSDCVSRNAIQNAPTIEAAPVVHAEWFDIRFDPMWKSMLATCSHCKVRGEVRVKANECGFAVPDSEYCPNCGAVMDGGEAG